MSRFEADSVVHEPLVLDDSSENPPQRYERGALRASVHDPVLVGLFPDADEDGLTDLRDQCPNSELSATILLESFDSGLDPVERGIFFARLGYDESPGVHLPVGLWIYLRDLPGFMKSE